jgi:hypothetical protein
MQSEIDVALSLLNIIALMLPVLIILMEVVVNIRGSEGHPSNWGEFAWLQNGVYAIVLSGLAVIIYIIIFLTPTSRIPNLPGDRTLILYFSVICVGGAFVSLLISMRKIA